MTNCFIKLSDLKGNIQEILNRLFNCVSYIMRVNVIHAHCPTPRNFLHAFTALKSSTHTVKTDPNIQFMTV